MKFLVLLVLLVAYVCSCLGLKNEICGYPHSRNGDGFISCEAYIPSWTYDAEAKECVKFIYGGCGGNRNRFFTKQDCDEKCLE